MAKLQGGTCAYCMRQIAYYNDGLERIRTKEMRIEHYQTRESHDALCFEWTNLLGLYTGLIDQESTCDRRRGSAPLNIDPRKRADIDTLSYQSRGELRSSAEALQRDLDDVLGLNTPRLRDNRKQALEGMREGIQRRLGTGDWHSQRQKLLSILEKLAQKQPLNEYFGAIEYWIRKKAKRRAS